MSDKYFVYMHTNKINGKVYVGITQQNPPQKRWNNGWGYRHRNPYFYRAITKYGWKDGFTHEIIFKNISKEIACKIEQMLIKKCKKLGISYNLANGGEGVEAFPECAKEKLRQYKGPLASQYGKKHTQEQRKLQSEILKNRWRNHRDLMMEAVRKGTLKKIGKKINIPEATRIKMSEESRQRLSIPVVMLDSNNNFIREFSSCKEAEQFFNGKSHHIGCVCKGVRKTAYGYKWKYKKEYYGTN